MDCENGTDTGTDTLMNVAELGAHLRVTRKAVYEMVHKREIPDEAIIRIGRRLRFYRKSIYGWLESKRGDAGCGA